ncbi:hypothetical protein FTDG_00564 [Francisella tularensis subsp. novicida GA99-3548]|uniref:FAD-binding and (Fe-S)-binding domain-containing protein n=1 Tax=Francisella tularensis TaxID=263 RepID=UPI000158B2CD|nr:FAD-binding and (Fe-S)-binding domain-containing protein [Francisella tularensis]AJI73780.1 4Fe-4S dicluster domain protein [Francisella tularensis subsp. novicida D9876]EDN37771.1 hypothetical protein FTDG_00564 [Francisella tularensis subsp. novicida GA99-3548]MBK2111463.1 FAD-binding oxidoreductase [Francisella tularensis subsp. novicida FSC159]
MEYDFQNFILELENTLDKKQIIIDEFLCFAYSTDASLYRLLPKAVLHINTEEEVLKVIELANTYKVPLTFRAAGTSLNGQGITDHVLVVITNKWNNYSIENDGEIIRLQPSLTGGQANLFLNKYGRKIGPDPSSVNVAKIGGIVANNASGMCCGFKHNSYNTLQDIRVIFSDGQVLDTKSVDSREKFRKNNPRIISKISSISQQVKSNQKLVDFIKQKYQIKNTMGYAINALIDFDDEIDIISHLMVGSEGTLGFISEFSYRTIPNYIDKSTAFIFFKDIRTCAEAITAISKYDVAAAEIMSYSTLMTIKDLEILDKEYKEQIRKLEEGSAALMFELDADSSESLEVKKAKILEVLKDFEPLFGVNYVTEASKYNRLWDVRRAVLPCAGNKKPALDTLVMEDVAFPVESLADGITDLENLLEKYRYDKDIAGHALTGNLHFNLSTNLEKDEEIQRYKDFMQEFTDMVVKKYNGSLKAEHGTGRNMAPFVAKEWGDELYKVMQEIKLLLDPHNLFNPGVILNDDKDVFVKNFKRRVKLDKQADKCLECGFCESVCPSRELSLTPRQRLSVYKEMMILKETDKAKYKDYKEKYQYHGIDTCAATGLCGVQCPVDINTGSFIKDLRAEQNKANIIDSFMFKYFSSFATVSNVTLKISRGFSRILGDNILRKLSLAVHKVLGKTPVWNSAMPTGAKSLSKIKHSEIKISKPKVVYWPTCTTRIFGPSKDTNQNDTKQAAFNILEKSGYEVIVPKGLSNTCCGQPFDSKGLYDKAEQKRQQVIELLKVASDNFSLPIVTDASPCSLRINEGMTEAKVYDSVEFIAKYCLDKLKICKIGKLAVHQTCSTQKAKNQQYMLAIAQALSDEIVIPMSVTCCGFAGDKGFTLPELNASALSGLKEEVKDCVCGISNSRTCEIGLSYHSGLTYYSAFDLLDKHSTVK